MALWGFDLRHAEVVIAITILPCAQRELASKLHPSYPVHLPKAKGLTNEKSDDFRPLSVAIVTLDGDICERHTANTARSLQPSELLRVSASKQARRTVIRMIKTWS